MKPRRSGLWALALLVACGGGPTGTPCSTELDCRGDRVCDDGMCRGPVIAEGEGEAEAEAEAEGEGPVLTDLGDIRPDPVQCGGVAILDGIATDLDGVADVIISFASPSGSDGAQFVYEAAPPYAGELRFEAFSTLGPFVEDGVWRFTVAVLTDGESHVRRYERDAGDLPDFLDGLSFRVRCDASDRTPPELVGVYEPSSGTEANPLGCVDTAAIRATARDDGTGLAGAALVLLAPGGTGALLLEALSVFPAGTADITLEATLSPWVESGSWTFASLQLWDRASNTTTYFAGDPDTPPALDALLLVVDCPDSDVTPPSIETVRRAAPAPARPGETVRITGTASDDVSGVASVRLTLASPDGFALLDARDDAPVIDGGFSCEGSVPADAEEGTWTLHSADVRDAAGNVRFYEASSADLPDDLVGYVVEVGP